MAKRGRPAKRKPQTGAKIVAFKQDGLQILLDETTWLKRAEEMYGYPIGPEVLKERLTIARRRGVNPIVPSELALGVVDLLFALYLCPDEVAGIRVQDSRHIILPALERLRIRVKRLSSQSLVRARSQTGNK